MFLKTNPFRIILVFFFIFLLTGCTGKGGESAGDGKKAAGGVKVTDASGREITFETHPKRFASLTVGDMDIIHQLGGEIVGRPNAKAGIPEDLLKAEEIGNTHQPNIEKIVSLKPDVLIANVGFDKNIPALENQGIRTIMMEANSIEDIKKNIETYGILLGNEGKAQALIGQIEQAVDKQMETSETRTLLVYGAPGSFLAALPTSLAGDILEKAGGINVAADFPKLKEYPQYAPLAAERVMEADPDVVCLITHGDPKGVEEAFKQEMKKNAAWKNLDAVKNGNIVVLPSDLFGINPGTKITEAVAYMRQILKEYRK
ncbi:MAG: iron-hydroxamate ABC transporter substrate-binding protein [Caldibacillus debilis]|uniref:Iron-hydroxamate ABC transporter substrate-binding protein n=1 Tax=Caldibacillus debilis TaxID=301148 RepID=A0A3E0JUZ7_9BACI|nr:MAG: iron-hydroxamate ABC transporter substrate-binding protein [Caldibacillus debilis]